jgi:hypothetical protein
MTPHLQESGLAALISSYRDAAREHGSATAAGEYRTANRRHDEIVAIYHELVRRGSEGRTALLSLLEHDDLSVRVWAAVHSLQFAPAEAEAVLEAIAQSPPGLVRLAAEYSLEEWRKGTLKLA